MTETVDEIVTDRDARYGRLDDFGKLCQSFKGVLRSGKAYPRMSDMQREAAEMILHKLSRIANGDPNERDSWKDLAGYAIACERLMPLTDREQQA